MPNNPPVPRSAPEAPVSTVEARTGDWATYRRLLGYIADQKIWFLLAAAGFLFAAGGEAGFALVLGLIVDALGYPMPAYVWQFPAIMLVLAVLRAGGAVAGEYALSRVSFRAVHAIRTHLFDRLLLLPSAYYDQSARGHLVSRLTFTTAQLRDATADVLKVLVADGLKVVVFLAAMVYQNWLLTLAFFVVAPLVAAIVRYASPRFRRLSGRIQDSMGDVTHVAAEAVGGYREVRIFGGEARERERFQQASEQNRRQNLKMTLTKATSAQVIQFLAAAALAALVCLVFLPWVGGGMTPGALAGYLALAGALANPIKKLSDLNARLQRGLAAAHDIFSQLDQRPESDTGELDVPRVRGDIRFEEVSFRYGERPPVLRDVSLAVQPGQTVALVGRSGAGKTTLASLIARFYEPTSGHILLDGQPLADYRLSCLRRQIALVTQDVTLFNDTLANNIAYGALAGADKQALDAAVSRAQAKDFVDQLPDGIDTVVGDDGVLLSGGQRQRVAIARALLKDAPVLILDEATSSLDAASERKVQTALEEVMHGRTTFVIAHRLSTVEKADVIAVVEDGAIVETGSHAALVAAGGAYAKLYESQFQAKPNPAATGARRPRRPTTLPVATTLAPLVRGWYDGRFWPRLLWPLGALFGWLAGRRRRRYLSGRAKPWRAPVPVVVVGNITAGGTGKTPLVIWLTRWLVERGRKPGVVSRGYGGKASYPLLVNKQTPAARCGDEAAMVARRTGRPVVVDPNRPRAVRALLASADVDVVLADDGLQHYALARDVEIAVLDGQRGVGNGLCLPAGPLREPVARLRDCDWVVANGTAPGVVEQESVMAAEAQALVNVASGERLTVDEFTCRFGFGDNLAAIAGIGNPARFQATLSGLGLTPTLRAFPDHHRFTLADVQPADAAAVLMTEKDAEKLRSLGPPANCWYLEINMRFLQPVDELLEALLRAKGVPLDAPNNSEPALPAQSA